MFYTWGLGGSAGVPLFSAIKKVRRGGGGQNLSTPTQAAVLRQRRQRHGHFRALCTLYNIIKPRQSLVCFEKRIKIKTFTLTKI